METRKMIVETAALAGEIMLVSGAEIYRVEDTIHHILALAEGARGENIVLSTGIYLSLDDPEGEAITMVRRVLNRATNLNRIYLANEVSRELCAGQMSLEEAYEELTRIRGAIVYKSIFKQIGYVGTCVFFAVMFGGTFFDCLAVLLVGIVLAMSLTLARRIHFNDFCAKVVGSFFIGVTSMGLKSTLLPQIQRDTVIVSAIMPLVPGVVFTTAIRDTLNGDYSAGVARMLEAVVTALAVAAGVGASMGLFQVFMGGDYL